MSFEGSLEGVKVGIIGAGLSGIALASLAAMKKADVFVSDCGGCRGEGSETMASLGIGHEFGAHEPRLGESDMIVLSSGISPAALPIKEANERGIPIVGELDFVAPYLRGRLVGITGSNGKSTTTALVGHLLEGMGEKAAAIGNIGRPLADYADADLDFLVMELSSFQLHWARTLSVEIAIVTNLDPDHLDWHGSYERYIGAKANLLRMQKPGNWAILQARELKYFEDIPSIRRVALEWDHWGIPSDGRIEMGDIESVLWRERVPTRLFRYENLSLLGRHNLENAGMAMAAIQLLGLDAGRAESLLASFPALPHRCEAVATIDGVNYVDDSKGTNVAASVTALGSLPGPKVVILGGQGKGEEYAPLAEAVKKHARIALVLGEEREKIVEALQRAKIERIIPVRDMEEAVERAHREALPGETVLLSPACTSWDAYPNYKERGKHFKKLVLAIQGGESVGDPPERT